MIPKDFKSPLAGKCVRSAAGYWAFLPALLPPQIHFDNDLVIALSKADAALGEMVGLIKGGAISEMHMLIRTFGRREAVLSSRIEGTHTRLDELLLAEAEHHRATDDQDLGEVQNYVTAMEKGVKLIKTKPLAAGLILALHETLLQGVRGGEKTPGQFRKIQNFIGKAGDTVATAKYVPPPADELHPLLSNWEQFANERASWPDLVQCAILHAQFESIHPFLDGNGRVGRLLITLFLIERKRLPQPLLYLSAFIEAHRQEYYDALQGVRTDCDWITWLRFFLAGITETCDQAVRHAQSLDAMRRDYLGRLKGQHRAQALLEQLFGNPYIRASRAAELLKVTTPTAQRSIDALRKLDLLTEITGKKWGRIYVAQPILKALNNPPPERPKS